MAHSSPAQRAFVRNRAEELGYDVWEHFAVPPFFDRLGIEDARKPLLIIGGRGCGKTMLLRYLSHQSAFSVNRKVVPKDTLRQIGVCWRADTQFTSVMTGRGIHDDVWASAFGHLVAVVLGLEILASLESILKSNVGAFSDDDLRKVSFIDLAPYFGSTPTDRHSVHRLLKEAMGSFEMWVNNVRAAAIPAFLPGKAFLLALVETIRSQVPSLADSTYFIYLDEFENLLPYQHKIVNTYLKHSVMPLIFNVAMKRNAFVTRETTGTEPIMDIADFREHNLEEYLEESFEPFAAEILFLNLGRAGWSNVPFDVRILHDPEQLAVRKTQAHKSSMVAAASAIFPDVPEKELAKIALEDAGIRSHLLRHLTKALKERASNRSAQDFMDQTQPEASIVAPALLFRRTDPDEILDEMRKLRDGEPNRFSGSTNWIHNNFVGCLLHLYEPHSRTCPFYAGFKTFCLLARGNIRHLLELCHRSIGRIAMDGVKGPLRVDPIQQAEAARVVSTDFLGEIRSFGSLGIQLHSFVLRLGSVFALAHARPSQSEPEPSHFSIRERLLRLSDQDQQFIREAIKWSVLFEEEETKQKSQSQADLEYILNPIYAPYFRITYRKRRRLEFTAEQFVTLTRGTYDQVKALLKQFTDTWRVDLEEVNQTLFSHLKEEKRQ